MTEKKHIDRLFQEKFKKFEATPDDVVWDNIHKALHEDKRKRLVIPIWWWTGGVAAALILFFTLRPVLFSYDVPGRPENTVVGTEPTGGGSGFTESSDDASKDKSTIKNSSLDAKNRSEASEVADVNSKSDIYNTVKTDKPQKSKTVAKTDFNKKQNSSNLPKEEVETNALAKQTSDRRQEINDKRADEPIKNDINTVSRNEDEKTKIAHQAKLPLENKADQSLEQNKKLPENSESIEEAIAKANPTIEEEREEQPNRWNISPSVAPVYFNSMGKGSAIHSQFVNNSKSGDVHMSYGISGSYAINDKIKIRAGVNKVDLGYSTNGVVAFRDVHSFNTLSGDNSIPNINFSNQGRADTYMSTSNIEHKSAPQFVLSNPAGTLEQQFGYIEVPLELEYNLINTKFGFNVIGGFSTLFLNNNEVYSVLGSERLLLGDANNINRTSYSANVGLGLNYNISPTLKLNLEPMFKYQINTFNNTSGDFRPYFIGVYSGFSFKF